MKIIGLIVSFIATLVLSSLWSGYVLSKLWLWFMVPAFGLPVLAVGYAIGLALVVNYLTNHAPVDTKKDEDAIENLLKAIGIGILRPAIALMFGKIVTLFL